MGLKLGLRKLLHIICKIRGRGIDLLDLPSVNTLLLESIVFHVGNIE